MRSSTDGLIREVEQGYKEEIEDEDGFGKIQIDDDDEDEDECGFGKRWIEDEDDEIVERMRGEQGEGAVRLRKARRL